MALGLAALSHENLYYTEKRKGEGHFNPDYRRPSENKELREFYVKGEKVMAYSKKDAIKRMKHKNK